MNVSLLLRELILHACSFGRLRIRSKTERRLIEILIDQLQEVQTAPLQLPYPQDVRAQRAAQALSANPGDQKTLDQFCFECGASKRTLQRLFLEETGMTFSRWRQQLRLLYATHRLALGDKVTTAALDAGYNSTSAFISMFRRQLGTTPARYLQVASKGGRSQ